MFLPFVLCYSVMMGIYFMVISIMTSKGLKNIPAGESLQVMFIFGMVIMTILIIIFMLYINSFLIKRRKKEFGLYGILGLEKRHVRKVIVIENILVSIFSGSMGIIFGCVVGKLVFMLIYYSLKVTTDSKYIISYKAFFLTGGLSLIIFLLTSTFNVLQVSLANPIDLLKAQNMGEKKVKFILIKTIMGLSLITWAYYTAISVTNAMSALNKFFIAVLAVIAATYLLFEAGSLFFLSVLKSRKKIYYRTNNFISISGMLHRMKQNAAGLASICILSTMVLVTVSTCTALYVGQEDILKQINPSDIVISINDSSDKAKIEEVETYVESIASEFGVGLSDLYGYKKISTSILLVDNTIQVLDDKIYSSNSDYEKMNQYIKMVEIITQDYYNEIQGESLNLGDKELVLLCSDTVLKESDNVGLPGDFTIKEINGNNKLVKRKNSTITEKLYMIVKDDHMSNLLYADLEQDNKGEAFISGVIIADVGEEGEKIEHFSSVLRERVLSIEQTMRIDTVYTNRSDGYGIYGGLLFLGIFFAIQFLSATVLIIYFKQVSEGYDDSGRFVIMQNVGMDEVEVKRTINKQILLVFFLPLVSALIHVAFARLMIIKLLETFSLYNKALTTWCMVITSLVFTICYIFFYKQTAKVYYRLVKR